MKSRRKKGFHGGSCSICQWTDEVNGGVCQFSWLGRLEYGLGWDLQKALAEARAGNRAPDTLLLLEHPPTYTLGRRGSESNLLVSRQTLDNLGVALYRVDRGGDITFHGPGQLVGYPVLSLETREGGPSRYLRDIEETLIRALHAFGVPGRRLPGLTGVWVGEEKIAAIGVKINAKRITQHGFSLNVTTDLSYFRRIVPCGIRDKGVTSLSRVLGCEVGLLDVAKSVAESLACVFGLSAEEVDPATIAAQTGHER